MEKWDYMIVVESQMKFRWIEGNDSIEEIRKIPFPNRTEKEKLETHCQDRSINDAMVMIGEQGWELVCITNSSVESNRRLLYFKKRRVEVTAS
jgi:hypothetical protein